MAARPQANPQVNPQLNPKAVSPPPANPGRDESGLTRLRKKLIRRAAPDHSQPLRRSFQFAFLLLNVWIGAAFFLNLV